MNPKTEKIKNLYLLISYNVIVVVLLLFLINGLASWAIALKKSYSTDQSISRKLALDIYPGMSKTDLASLLEETWSRSWKYVPWVGFKEAPRTGKFVNISEEGFRHSYRKDLKLDEDGYTIFVFGGSTTFGYGVDDASTISSHLQRQLAEKYPDKKIKFYNFGRGYYFSTQELVLFLNLLRNNHVPKIAIFIDGVNEGQYVPFYTEELSYLFDAYNLDDTQLISAFFSKTATMQVFNKLKEKLPKKKKAKKSPAQTIIDEKGLAKLYNTYITNMGLITALAEKYKVTPYFFIQPVPGYQNNFLNHTLMPKHAPAAWRANMLLKMQLLEHTADNRNSFSLTNLLKDYSKQPFVDDVHYTSEVCNLIAAAIAQKIQVE